jgi:uncharacterized protein (DUF58 family)
MWIKVIIGLLFINAVVSGGEFQYFLLFAMLTTLLFNYKYLLVNKKNLNHLFFSNSETGTVGEKLKITYKLTNDGWVPIMNARVTTFISKRLGDSRYPVKDMVFKSYQFANIEHEIVLRHHGYYKLGKIHVALRDPINIFKRDVVFDKEIDLTIYPKIHEIERFSLPYREFFGRKDVKLKAYEDFTNIKSSREYVPGDSYKKIHWKLTAKKDALYVKEYNLSASGKVNIYLDAYQENYSENIIFDQDEKLVEIAGTLIKYYLKNKFEVSLIYLDQNKKRSIDGRSLKQFHRFLQALTGFTPNAGINMSRFLKNDTGKLTHGSTIVIITPKADSEIAMLCGQLKRRKFDVHLIALDDAETKIEQLESLEIDYRLIRLNDDIKMRLEGF